MRRALLLGLALTGGALAGMNHGGHTMSTPAGADAGTLAELRPLRGRAFDIAFTEAMLLHHRMAVQMARVQLERGKNARIKAAARQMVADQQREMNLMEGWLRVWKRPQNTMGGTLEAVGMSAAQVDRWFLTGMIPHHQGAVEMAKLVPARTQNVSVRKLAAQIIKTQTAEVNQYRAWLKTLP